MSVLNFSQLQRYVANLAEGFSNEDKSRWENGNCHSFAFALAKNLDQFLPEESEVSILIGTRNGINPDTKRRKNVFSHALVQIQTPDGFDAFDCHYGVGSDRAIEWESKWFYDDPDLVIERMQKFGFVQFDHPDETDSTFSWDKCAVDVKSITRVVKKIDGSIGPSEDEIAYAHLKIADLQEISYKAAIKKTLKP